MKPKFKLGSFSQSCVKNNNKKKSSRPFRCNSHVSLATSPRPRKRRVNRCLNSPWFDAVGGMLRCEHKGEGAYADYKQPSNYDQKSKYASSQQPSFYPFKELEVSLAFISFTPSHPHLIKHRYLFPRRCRPGIEKCEKSEARCLQSSMSLTFSIFPATLKQFKTSILPW